MSAASNPARGSVSTRHAPASGQGQVAALFTDLYGELCRMAHREVRRNGADGLLSTGTLVHEAWLDISRRPDLAFDERGRFLAYAARTMRGLAIDRLRARGTLKRGGDCAITSLDTHNAEQALQPEALEPIADALDELAQLEPELARTIELKYFCGFSLPEVATMEGVSTRTIQRRWDKARLLLFRALNEA